jgi:hypothetical protein
MLRTIFTIGLIAFAGLFLLKLFFGILGGLFGLLFALVGLAIPVLIIGGLIYLFLRIFAPETANDLRGRFGGS